MHVRLADESVCIGSHQPANSYLNISALMSAIDLTKAEAVHPGYGFLSENANFARVLEKNNIKFIGASSKLIEMMGDKIQAKKIAKEHGLPIIELHISNIYKREEFRRKSLISDIATGGIFGLGDNGYILAIIAMQNIL
jgi:acetyl/propionyl-CoA carboxylase alpha subunit